MQNRKIIHCHIPNFTFLHLIVSMNQHVTHGNDDSPGCFGMGSCKFLGQHICRFSDHFNVLDNSIIQYLVLAKIGVSLIFQEPRYAAYGFRDMLKTIDIPNALSHISGFYHVRQTVLRNP